MFSVSVTRNCSAISGERSIEMEMASMGLTDLSNCWSRSASIRAMSAAVSIPGEAAATFSAIWPKSVSMSLCTCCTRASVVATAERSGTGILSFASRKVPISGSGVAPSLRSSREIAALNVPPNTPSAYQMRPDSMASCSTSREARRSSCSARSRSAPKPRASSSASRGVKITASRYSISAISAARV